MQLETSNGLYRSSSSTEMTKFWNVYFLQLVALVNSCYHFFALDRLYAASVWTMTRRNKRVCRIVQILGSSLILVVGENFWKKSLVLSLTELGGVPLTRCSIISSHITRLQEDAPPQPCRSFTIVLMGAAFSKLSIRFSYSPYMSVSIAFASERNINSDNELESVHNQTIITL